MIYHINEIASTYTGSLIEIMAPEIFLASSILFILMFNVIYLRPNKKLSNNDKILYLNIRNPLAMMAIATLVITAFLIQNSPELGGYSGITHLFVVDSLSVGIKTIVCVTTVFCLLMIQGKLKRLNIIGFNYTVLFLFAVLGMLLMISSVNLLSLYVSIELQTLSFYLLSTLKKDSEYSSEAGFKYFILGVFASGFLLLGFAIIYGITGTTDLNQLSVLILNIGSDYEGLVLTFGLIFVLGAILFKLGAIPFHSWLPDVYQGSPLSVTAFFAIVPKIVVVGLIIRIFLHHSYSLFDSIQIILASVSGITMVIAAFAAFNQVIMIRLIAYSAIGHAGYILMGLSTGSLEGIESSLLYMILYIIAALNVFSVLTGVASRKDLFTIKYITDITGLARVNPLLAANIAIAMFSMAGVPPLSGFFGKLFVFSAAINNELYLLAIIGAVTSVLSAVYYIYIIKVMYFDKTVVWLALLKLPKLNAYIISATFIIMMFFFLFPTPFFSIVHDMAITVTI